MGKLQFPDFEQAIGAGILATRKARGIDRRAFARAIGVTYQQAQKYETGRNRIPVSRFLDMSRALGVEPAALIATIAAARPADHQPEQGQCS